MRLRSLVIVLFMLVCSLMVASVSAQDSPPGVYEAAVRATNSVRPDLGKPSGMGWARLNPTKLSNLGCPLVQGTDLGREVTPYSISLSYGAEKYVVHVSADSTLTQLCDPKFGTLVASTPAPPSGCQIAAAAQPKFYIAPDTSTAILGGDVMVNGINYAIGRTDTRDWFQTRNNANQIGWVSIKEVTVSGTCDSLPVTGAKNIDYITVPCFVTAAQDFSNVRQLPSTNAPVLARMFENSYWQVYATTTDGQWVFINPGWVADRVTEKYGDCDSLIVNNDLVGELEGTPTPGPSPTTGPIVVGTPAAGTTPGVVDVPANSNCPTGFSGFMAPRINKTTGARVVEGGNPNRLRQEPNTQALQVGEAQPGRTLGLLDGPMCSSTYVWWFVEIDGVQGWTAESDASDGSYFLEPIGAPVLAVQASATPQSIVVAVPTATAQSVVIGSNPAEPTSNAVLVEVPNEVLGAVADIRLSSTGDIYALEGTTLEFLKDGFEITGSADILTENIVAFDITDDRLFALDEAGTIHSFGLESQEEIANSAIALGEALTTTTINFTSDGAYFLTVGCNNDDCTQGKIDLWETASATVLRSQPAHLGQPLGAWFTPDNKYILSMGIDGLQVWDTQTGAFVGGVELGETTIPTLPVISADSDYYYIAVCVEVVDTSDCAKTELKGWAIATGAQVTQSDVSTTSAPNAIAISSDDEMIAIALQNGTVQFWPLDAATDAYVQGTIRDMGTDIGILSMILSTDKTEIAVGTVDSRVHYAPVPQS